MRSVKWWTSQFPEALYPPHPDYEQEYVERVLTGFEIASRSHVIIAGLCRDNEDILPLTLNRIEKLAGYFQDANLCILENDSVDRTPDVLAHMLWDYPYESRAVCKKLNMPKHGSVKTHQRIVDMARLRTELQGMVEKTNEEYPSEYVILIDLDIHGFSYEGILHSLTFEFDAMASNSLIYQDLDGKTVRRYFDSYGSKFNPEKTDEEKNLLLFHRGDSLIKVDSAFGGLCIYNTKAYLNGKYGVADWQNHCEHIPFHKNMNCLINPSQITLYNKTRYSI